ncbi:uncharacterized protein SOCE26_012730 [Sorangium cellulosum]|uniref:Uncharacterized protein n=1 Tax=Sorangium cellulosum TaxID=56 RepID=A0A2L0EKT5_SORCE|nr:hypothetical protein [Sorangium cellulosum]AUX39878.1 uncharacterized protein SOCE26_012730 [Sorangium cellulosum]
MPELPLALIHEANRGNRELARKPGERRVLPAHHHVARALRRVLPAHHHVAPTAVRWPRAAACGSRRGGADG